LAARELLRRGSARGVDEEFEGGRVEMFERAIEF
jgi:hypothetical protein